MPFAPLYTPPAGLGAIKSMLTKHGYPVKGLNVSAYLARTLGLNSYLSIAQCAWLGEAIYSLCLFPSRKLHAMARKNYSSILDSANVRSLDPRYHDLDNLINDVRHFNKTYLMSFCKKRYDVVGFSLLNNQLLASLYFSRHYKDRYPDTKVVFGGSYCNGDIGVSYLRSFPWLDFVVNGEGEKTIIDLLHAIESGDEPVVPGCASRIGKNVIIGPHRPPILDLDKLPCPDYADYFRDIRACGFTDLPKAIPMETSRGCWWNNCTFCSVASINRRYRRFAPNKIYSNIRTLSRKYRFPTIELVDLVQYRPLKKLLDVLSRHSARHTFTLSLRASTSPQEINALRNVGFSDLYFGIESLSTSLLKKMQKGISAIQNIQSIKYAHMAGIPPHVFLINGYPGETIREYEETILNLKRAWHLLNGFTESSLMLVFSSHLFNQQSKHGITCAWPSPFYQALFPHRYGKMLKHFFWNFESVHKSRGSYRDGLIKRYGNLSSKPFLLYSDANGVMIIDDRRTVPARETKFNGTSRQILLYCKQIQSVDEIQKHLSNNSKSAIKRTLYSLCRRQFLFREGDKYLALAVPQTKPPLK